MISLILFGLVIWLFIEIIDLEERLLELETRQDPEKYNG